VGGKESKEKAISTLSKSRQLAARFGVLKKLNSDVMASLEGVDWSLIESECSPANAYAKGRSFIFSAIKADLMKSALERSKSSIGSSSKIELTMSRVRSKRYASRGECDTEGNWSCYAEAFKRLHGLPPATFRRSEGEKLWEVTLAGEMAQDAGGPYRESWTMLCAELMSKALPLLRPCPNAISLTGANRETWVLNSDATTPIQLQMLVFLGKLMGMAIRTKEYMDLYLSPIVWKLIARENVTFDDVREIDKSWAGNLEKIRAALINAPSTYALSSSSNDHNHTNQSSLASSPSLVAAGGGGGGSGGGGNEFPFSSLDFTIPSISGRIVELHPGGKGKRLTWSNALRYCEEVEAFRVKEMDKVALAVRAGLVTQVPPVAISLLRGYELEELVCGKPDVDLQLLKRATEYHVYNESSQEIKVRAR